MNGQDSATRLLTVAFLSTSMLASADEYVGAWFKVWYPDSFEVIPSMASTTAGKGVDSAFFRSPDGQVEFYIFSPQWSGEPNDIAIHPSRDLEGRRGKAIRG